jgi:hypothetical protein
MVNAVTVYDLFTYVYEQPQDGLHWPRGVALGVILTLCYSLLEVLCDENNTKWTYTFLETSRFLFWCAQVHRPTYDYIQLWYKTFISFCKYKRQQSIGMYGLCVLM